MFESQKRAYSGGFHDYGFRPARRPDENSFMSFSLLLATNGSCGCLRAVLTAGRELRRRGHAVRLIADQAMRAEAEAAGFEVSTWKHASIADAVEANPSLEDGPRKTVLDPIAIQASEIRDELDRVATDAILSIDMLFGAAIAAEAAVIPIVTLSRDDSVRPLPAVPPRGGALKRPKTSGSSETTNSFVPALNEARADLGLPSLSDASDQFDRGARIFISSEQDFDPQAGPLPENVRYVGLLRQECMHDGLKAGSAERVDIVGLSAGEATAATMRHHDCYAAVGVHSGLPSGAAHDLNSALAAMSSGSELAAESATSATIRHAMPTIVFHGDLDATVNPINGDEVAAQALRATALASKSKRKVRSRHRDTSGFISPIRRVTPPSSNGPSMTLATPGPAAARPDLSPIRMGRVRRLKCRASFSGIPDAAARESLREYRSVPNILTSSLQIQPHRWDR